MVWVVATQEWKYGLLKEVGGFPDMGNKEIENGRIK
jgi:hypothetical protein